MLLKNPHFMRNEEQKCHAVFSSDSDTLGFSPEYFSRLNGEIYLSGLNSTMIPLPETTDAIKSSEESITKLKDCAAIMLDHGESKEDLVVIRESLV